MIEDSNEPEDLDPNIVVIDCGDILRKVKEFKEI